MKIKKEDFCYIVIDALETGIGYWADLENFCTSETVAEKLWNGEAVTLIDVFDGERLKLTKEKVIKGIETNIQERPWDCNIENTDATTVDCIIQYGLFNELVYG